MWAGGPPKPISPIRSHSLAIVPRGTVGRFILRQDVKRQRGVRRADAGGLPGRGRGDPQAAMIPPDGEIYGAPGLINSGTYHGFDGFQQWIEPVGGRWDEVDYELQDPVGFGETIVVIPRAHHRARSR